jgi:hypothetical protein
MPFHHDQYQESQRKWREKKETEEETKKSKNDKEKPKIPLLPYHLYQCFQGLHIVSSNYLISDASWDGLAAEQRSKLYGIEEIELRTPNLSSLFTIVVYLSFCFLMPISSLSFVVSLIARMEFI